MTLAVRLLGPLEVECDGGRVVFGAPMERALVALLALSVGRVVSTDRVIDELWLEPPPSARRSIRVLVSRVRTALGEFGAGATLLTRSPGYMFDGAAVVVDAVQFETLAASGHALLAEGRVDEVARMIGGAAITEPVRASARELLETAAKPEGERRKAKAKVPWRRNT